MIDRQKKITELYNITKNKENLLHPSFYKYISCPETFNLICNYEKTKIRQRVGAVGVNWGLQPHQLRIKTGSFAWKHNLVMKNPTIATPEMMEWIISTYHGLRKETFSAGNVSGMILAEGSFKFVKGNGPATVDCPFGISQNHRQTHQLEAIGQFFGIEHRGYSCKQFQNSSSFTQNTSSLKNASTLLLPKLVNLDLIGTKHWDLSCYIKRIEAWAAIPRTAGPSKGIANMAILNTYKQNMRNFPGYRPLNELLVTTDFVAGFTDGDGGITLDLNIRTLQFSQKERYVLERLNKYFGGLGSIRKKVAGGYEQRLFFNNNAQRRKRFDLLNSGQVYRTDQAFKKEVQLCTSPTYNDFMRKLPEYMPRIMIKLHRYEAGGGVLPDVIAERLHKHYPQSLGLYYKDIYKNIFTELNIDHSKLPFVSLLVYF